MNSPSERKMNPFPGLRAFRQDEDYLFFGREEQTMELLQRLGGNRFVAVVGTSGSGKSSLVRCGLLSELLGGKMLGAGASWEIAVTHPGGNPLALLTDALLDADLYDREEENVRENLLATLSRSHFGLVEAVKQADLGEDTNFLLVVDQFEEIFRFHEAGQRQKEAANEFVSILLEAATQKEVPIYVVLTMRSDFIGECGQFEGLAEMVNRGEFLIPRLTREQYKRVIEGPIKVAGGQLAPRLLQRLLNDLGQQADQLPCLQHALMRTWDVWAGKEKKGEGLISRNSPEGAAQKSDLPPFSALDLDDYQSVGRMAEALSLHADEIYDSLASDRQRTLCEGMFQALTVQESSSRGIRRPQRLSRLCQILEVNADELLPIIDAYRQHGVTFLMPSPEVELTEQTIIDISHESLMRVWTRLRQWVEEETQAAGIYHRLAESAALHEQGKAGLYRDPELGIALAWQDARHPNAAWAERYRPGFAKAIAFLEASQQASLAEEQTREAARQRELAQAQKLAESQQLRLEVQQRSAKKLRKLIAGLAVVLVIAGIACVVAVVAYNQAQDLAEMAREKADEAEQNFQDANRQRDTARLAELAMEKTAAEAAAAKTVAERESYRSTIRLAESMLQGSDDAKSRVADILWETQRELRGWELGHLMAQCPLEEWSLQTDEGGLRAFCATANGRFLMAGGNDGTVSLWDVDARRQLWKQATGQVYKLAVDPLNRYVGVSTDNNTLPQFRILDLTTGKILHESEQTGKADIAFSASGKEIYAFDNRGVLRRITASTWEEQSQTVATELSAPAAGEGLEWNTLFTDAGGDYVGIFCQFGEGGNSRKFQLFDAHTLNSTDQLEGFQEEVRNVRSPSTPVLHSAKGEVIYSFTNFVYRKSLDGTKSLVSSQSEYVKHLAVDPDSGVVLAATESGLVQMTDADGGEHTIRHGAPITGLAILPRGRFVTAGADGLVKCWNLTPPTELSFKTPAPISSPASSVFVGFASDGKSLLFRTWDRHNFLYELDSLRYRHFVFPDRDGKNNIFPFIRPETNELVADTKASLLFFPPESNGLDAKSSRSISVAAPQSAAFDSAGRILVVSSDDGSPTVFDLETNEQFPRPQVKGTGPIAINPSGTRAALRTKEQLQVWEIATGRLLNSLDVVDDFGNPLPPAFHPDGELIVVVEHSQGISRLYLWDSGSTRTHSVIPALSGIQFGVCQFSADGDRLFVRSSNDKIRVLDWRLGKELLALSGGNDVTELAVSSDGLTVAYAGFSPSLFVAKSLPWQGETPRDAGFYRAVDELRLFTARTAQTINESADLMEFTNNSDKPIRIDYITSTLLGLIRSAPRTHSTLPARETIQLGEVPSGVEFLFIDPESSEQLASFTKTDVAVRTDEGPVGISVVLPGGNPVVNSGIEELQGDVAHRQGRLADANAHYTTVVSMGKEIVLENPSRAASLGRLAIAFQKKMAVMAEGESDNNTDDLQQAISFWQTLMQNPDANPIGWEHLLSFQTRLLDHQISLGKGDARESLSTWLSFWADESARQPTDRLFRYSMSQLCQRLSVLYPTAADAEAVDQLAASHPELTGLIGDMYSAQGDWERAIAIYSKGISAESADSELLTKRASASEQLQNWAAAAADWQRVATIDKDGGLLLTGLVSRLTEAGQSDLSEAVRTNARSLLAERLQTEPKNPQIAGALADVILMTKASHSLLPTSESEGVEWLSTTTSPPDDWMREDFDDSGWQKQLGGFGSMGTSGLPVRTAWTTNDIWLRRTFDWQPTSTGQSLVLRVIYDDDVEIFINGRQVANLPGWTSEYITQALDESAVEALHAGTNTIAVHCRQFSGGQCIDAGLTETPYEPRILRQRLMAIRSTDPWQKLAAAYYVIGDETALGELLNRHPAAAAGVGELYAADKHWEQAIAAYSQSLTDRPEAKLLCNRAEAYFATRQWDLARNDVRQAVAQQPDLAQREFDRFRLTQRWTEAAEFGRMLIDQNPQNTMLWVQVSPLAALSDDEAVYGQLCRRVMELYREAPTTEAVDRVMKACLLKRGAIDVSELPLDTFPTSLDATAPDWLPPWYWGTQALLACRSGDVDSAVKYVKQSEEYKPGDYAHAMNLAILAIAHQELQHPDEARSAVEEATQLIERLRAGDRNNHDLLIAEILFREAEAVIDGSENPKPPDAATVPESGTEPN